MSGGSFNYLCQKSLTEALADRGMVEDMAQYLEVLAREGHFGTSPAMPKAAIAARELRAMLAVVDALVPRFEELAPVLKAAEWLRSGDWAPEGVAEALEKLYPPGGTT